MVVIAGVALVTVRSSQPLDPPLLLASPEYTALKLNVPLLLKVTALEFGTTPLLTVTIETNVPGAMQLPFAKSLYVTVPPAVEVWPCSTDVSETVPPTTMELVDRLVVIVATTGLTVRGSQLLLTPLLLASPE